MIHLQGDAIHVASFIAVQHIVLNIAVEGVGAQGVFAHADGIAGVFVPVLDIAREFDARVIREIVLYGQTPEAVVLLA